MKSCLYCAYVEFCIQKVRLGVIQENLTTCNEFLKCGEKRIGECEISRNKGYIEIHHINPIGSHPSLKFALLNLSALSKDVHSIIHTNGRKELTWELFLKRYKNPGWHEWQLKQGSKLYIKFLEAKCLI